MIQRCQSNRFLGQSNTVFNFGNIEITESVYSENKIDWHYHENAHFTFILTGEILDGNKIQQQHCSPGTILFHNWQEPHYNIMYGSCAKSLHFELKTNSGDNLLSRDYPMGRMNIEDAAIKILFYQIYKETQICDSLSVIAIESLFLNAVNKMVFESDNTPSKTPLWVRKVKDILYSQPPEGITLKYLAKEAGIHPVHLSRHFSRYFHCSLGCYLRKIRVEKALKLLLDGTRSLTEIAFDCGFADQSHFLRCFKQIMNINPSAFRKFILQQKEC